MKAVQVRKRNPDDHAEQSLDQTLRGTGELARIVLDRDDTLAQILDLADDAIISVDTQQRVILFNQGAEKMFGYTSEEMSGRMLDLLLPGRIAGLHREHIEAFSLSGLTARRMGERREIMGLRKDGTEFPAEASISKVSVKGEIMFTVIMRDVTQRSQDDQRLKASLREKEVLLEEVHHRVKNNLQVVSSLLGLQARSIGDSETRKKLQESQHRVQSMALLHECLYRSDDLARIDFADYIEKLSEQLFHSYGAAGHVHLKMNLAKLHLDMDAAVPCGLIVNELLSNALKYGFPDGRTGEVRVELSQPAPDTAQLTVTDNGVGLPEAFDWTTSRTLGLRLVRTLAQQLNSELECSRAGGTKFSILFPIKTRTRRTTKPWTGF
ncbi:MAG: histidine kinase dimerization/phosphoacceptor domain -containing protein [Acidobacteriota bacterium]